jgi:hypothetical protein
MDGWRLMEPLAPAGGRNQDVKSPLPAEEKLALYQIRLNTGG